MINHPTLYSFPTSEKLSESLASTIITAQDAALKRHNTFRIAVSGGSLPQYLSSPHLTQNPSLKLDKWEVFYADERCVPNSDPESNNKAFEDKFLNLLSADSPRPTVHKLNEDYLHEDNDPSKPLRAVEDIPTQDISDDYEQQLVRVFAAKDSVKLPIFDLLLLGCGPDGHTCSLFPGHELLREDVAWVAPIEDSPKPPPKRITLTMPVVTHALRIVFVAAGAGKQGILKQIFDKEEEGLPCVLVNKGAGEKVAWFCDEAATGGVEYPVKSSL
ncbi:6-phosphogluconolactonase [Ascobolus immersus RN42]|uniref:6-phosphogluconolactonase n=1 Tax=Ascobolus immersus RN42 TaxID=1160509 RepID=A0A3N4HHK7_ASCIM|nr:6-phosphogluconolactonase [Ascobolus immersus RN42]